MFELLGELRPDLVRRALGSGARTGRRIAMMLSAEAATARTTIRTERGEAARPGSCPQ